MARAHHFSVDYFEARSRFRNAAVGAGGELIELPIAAIAPGGGALTIDVAWFGPEQPEQIFVHSCGVHGVEAFAGSAIQLAWLEEHAGRWRGPMAVALVHAVNPFGMAWRRRVNERNVDLNRNCLRPGERYAGAAEGYRLLDGFLNPRSAASAELFALKVAWLIARHGLSSLKQSIAEGQYDFPQGLFYGGASLEEGPGRLLELMTTRLSRCRRIVALDVHSGLGAWASETYLVDGAASPATVSWLRERFGDRLATLDPNAGVAYRPRGLYETLFQLAAPQAAQVLLGQEFGTYSPVRVLEILRRENREFHFRPGGVSAETAQELSDRFVPRDDRWRENVVERGLWAMTICAADQAR